jgi:hypothetical protein
MPRCRLFFSLELAGDRLYYIHQVSSYGSLICSPTLRQSRSFDTYAWTCLSTTNLLVLPTATFPSAYARSPVSLIFPTFHSSPVPNLPELRRLKREPHEHSDFPATIPSSNFPGRGPSKEIGRFFLSETPWTIWYYHIVYPYSYCAALGQRQDASVALALLHPTGGVNAI